MRGVVCAAVLTALFMTGAAAEEVSRPKDPLFRLALAGYVALQVTDAYLTQRGTSRGLDETNPVLSSGESVVAAKLILVPLTTYGLVRLHRSHPKLATVLAIGLNAVYLGVARRNLRAINEVD